MTLKAPLRHKTLLLMHLHNLVSLKSYFEILRMHRPLLLITDENFLFDSCNSYSQDLFIIQTNEDLDSESWFLISLAVLPISSLFTFCIDKAF